MMGHFTFGCMSLALALLTTTASASADVSISPEYRLVPSSLEETEVTGFLQCVKATKKSYNVGVDTSGYIVVTPSGQRALNFKAQDSGLVDCMTEFADTLQIAAESTKYAASTGTESAATVSFQWLSSKGAQGQTRQKVATPTVAAAHSNSTFSFFRDNATACGALNTINSQLKECYSYPNPWASQKIENFSKTTSLLVSIWPDAACKKSDFKTYVIPDNSITTCLNRVTYSFAGAYNS